MEASKWKTVWPRSFKGEFWENSFISIIITLISSKISSTLYADGRDKDKFKLRNFNCSTTSLPRNDMVLIGGEWNARVGHYDEFDKWQIWHRGPVSQWRMLSSFCRRAWILFFRYQKKYLVTCNSLANQYSNQIDLYWSSLEDLKIWRSVLSATSK